MVTREQVAQTLEEIALLLELKGENPFKSRAYRTGAELATSHTGDFLQLARDGKLTTIKGFGAALAEKTSELVMTGKMTYHERLRGEFPPTVFELFEIQGVGPKKIKALFTQLGVASVADLKRVCESGEASKLTGFGKKTCEKILEAIAFREQNAERHLLAAVAPIVDDIREFLRAHPAVSQVDSAGSVRRGKETVHDLDFIVATKAPGEVMSDFVAMDSVAEVLVNGKTKSSVHLKSGVQCDLRAVSNEEYPFALNYFTGSKEHNVAMRSRARERGWTLNEYRLAPIEGKKNATTPPDDIATEDDLYRALGLSYIEPALRENQGEFDASESESLPKLLETSNLRGTFHNHTTASDGKNTLEEMAAAADELGLQYLGIADHSKGQVQANGLDADRLAKQVEAIREFNASGVSEVHLFAGVECDILRDGALDFDDEILAPLDYVVASVHSAFNLSEEEQTNRFLKAIANPNVTMLGHLTGRLLLRREPYAVDVSAIIDACAENGTWIELNASPRRLDMDWRWWRHARDRGVRCVINPDAHRTDELQHLKFGVLMARKGWLRREDVMNCLSLKQIEKQLKMKRESAAVA